MGQPSMPFDVRYELERLRAEVNELYRRRPRRTMNIGHLQDVKGYGAASGHTLVYDQASGTYKPALAPPTITFNKNGTLSVSSADEDPMGGAGRLIQVAGRLTTAGSSTTTALLKLNGATIATFTFASGSHLPTTTPAVSSAFVLDDYFSLAITAAGTGAAGLVVNGWATA